MPDKGNDFIVKRPRAMSFILDRISTRKIETITSGSILGQGVVVKQCGAELSQFMLKYNHGQKVESLP